MSQVGEKSSAPGPQGPVRGKFRILISDRNYNVREFLKREMTEEGYQVETARSTPDILSRIGLRGDPVDLVVLDPELPDQGDIPLLHRLRSKNPYIPIVLHGFQNPLPEQAHQHWVAFVEKSGSNMHALKKRIRKLLATCYPERFRQQCQKQKEEDSNR
ncbi:MAG: response regulator [Deltaproteobacteria bacterium]|nr:response regulator [Deltaproteobacteria bacterium]MBW1923123.1 response regulator [Deltaproteobacteria bacterium]MBW1949147.1 response regulator [Deltaproteobacteria bacterium]MBW2007530.1 response regulator [Deltaproteobacteria bacterium]MBW2101532.1 response regulator [Deltaproteobacteria bacterium]